MIEDILEEKGNYLQLAAVANIARKSTWTVYHWVRDGVLVPDDWVDNKYALFRKDRIAELAEALQKGKSGLEALEQPPAKWRLDDPEKGTFLYLSSVSNLAGKASWTVWKWVRDGTLIPDDWSGNRNALFRKDHVEELLPYLRSGKAALEQYYARAA